MPCPPSRHLSRRQLLLATAAACLLGPSGTASAQGATPLKLVITFPPGGQHRHRRPHTAAAPG